MRTSVPIAFTIQFIGAEGPYTISFQATDGWPGCIDVTILESVMRWNVLHAERDVDGGLVLGGMTSGSEAVWADQFWFELRSDDKPPVIRYWGDRIVWREDRSAEPSDSPRCVTITG